MAMAYPIFTQSELDREIAWLREDGYPYLGSNDARWQLLPNGDILWDVPGEPEWGYTISTQDEFAESIFCWRHDC